MKKIIAALALSMSVMSPAVATDKDWSTGQMALAGVALTAHVMDWNQTRVISKNPDRFYERGFITKDVIGAHPSTGQVDAYMLGSAVLFMLAAHYLPEYRYTILGVWAVTRIYVVHENKQIGLSASFNF